MGGNPILHSITIPEHGSCHHLCITCISQSVFTEAPELNVNKDKKHSAKKARSSRSFHFKYNLVARDPIPSSDPMYAGIGHGYIGHLDGTFDTRHKIEFVHSGSGEPYKPSKKISFHFNSQFLFISLLKSINFNFQ